MTTTTLKPGIPYVISAPSGTGKTTICGILRKKLPALQFSVSHTTRPKREGEHEGVDYFFISNEEFEQKIKDNEFLEWAKIHNNYYGTSFTTITAHTHKGRDLLLELDVQGVETLRNSDYPAVFIFILPPSLEELQRRLEFRGTESPEKIAMRLETGKNEILKYPAYDYVLTNYIAEETANDIASIMCSEKLRAGMYAPTASDIQTLLNQKTNASCSPAPLKNS
jgi:guanylate kinase